MTEGSFEGAEGVKIFTREWQPASEPRLPVFLLGHSAGGVIACGYALEHQSEIAGLICEEKAGSNDKSLKLYEGHFHDLLADIGKQQVMADIEAWIDAHLETVTRPARAATNSGSIGRKT